MSLFQSHTQGVFITKVLKRNDKREDFKRDKIRRGIERAADRAKIDKKRAREIADRIARDVEKDLRDRDEVRSEDIRNRVLEALDRKDRKIADAFRAFKR